MYDINDHPITENIKVFIRIRPPEDKFEPNIINLPRDNIISVSRIQNDKEPKTFKFSKVFDHSASQLDIYKIVAAPIVDRTLKGYNGTIFAYGQSGTGKTFTMIGNSEQLNLKGIIPNVFSHIFAQISLADHCTSYVVTATFLEIYNEEVRDLLSNSTKKLEVRESPELGVYVKDLSGYTVGSMDQILDMIARGNKNRAIGSTRLNDQSSRSHAIFTVLVEAKPPDDSTSFGKLNLVDLAGSERVSKSFASGDRLREAGKINLSLSVLGNVISALIDGKTSHIPYRNSKLTRLLQDSLGGSCLTAMIATVSAKEENFEETYYTLMYADRVKHITNCVKKNEENKSILKTFEDKIKQLQRELDVLNLKEIVSVRKHNRRKGCAKEEGPEFLEIKEKKNTLLEKISGIQKKILIGGENLLEKAQLQLELLEVSAKELKQLDSSHQFLEDVLQTKGQEKEIVERKCLSLEEENKLLDKQIEEAEKMLTKTKEVLFKKEYEYQNEISSLLYTNKCLAKDMRLVNFVMNKYVPKEYLAKLKEHLVWDEDLQEWRVRFVPYSGNNMKKNRGQNKKELPVVNGIKKMYRKYPREENNI